MYASLPRPTIFAHRGSSAHAPENTLAAFEMAIRQGAEGIELDAKLTADDQVVVIHDPTVNRTTGVNGVVRQMNLAELKKLDAGSHFDYGFRGEHIPSLDEVFETVGHRIFINVELTNYTSPLDNLPEAIARIVLRHKLEKRILFSSFNPIALIKIKRLLPKTPIGLLALPGKSGAWSRSWPGRLIGYQALHPEASDLSEGLIKKIHQWDCRVHVYTVNSEQQMRQFFAWGVDGLITDDPVLARQALAENRQSSDPPT
jgi:glycerophosphoryl diester phosphodiesterase